MPDRKSLPIGIVWATRSVRGSIRITDSVCQLRNHTPSGPAAIVLGGTRASIVAMIRPVRGSMRETLGVGSIAHTAPAPTANCGNPALGGVELSPWSGSFTVRVTSVESGSTRETLTVL